MLDVPRRPAATLSWTGTSTMIPLQHQQCFPKTGEDVQGTSHVRQGGDSLMPAGMRTPCLLVDWTRTGSMTGHTKRPITPLSRLVAKIPWTFLALDGSVCL